MDCWARSRGNCCTTQSGEHYVSATLFAGLKIRVRGFSWCKDEDREIPVAKARANILCKHHNERLSELDSAAGDAFRVFKSVREMEDVREAMSPRIWMVKERQIQGDLLERWFLKTMINLIYMQEQETEWYGGGSGKLPPSGLVNYCYDDSARLAQPMGLYGIFPRGAEIVSRDYLLFQPFFYDDKVIAGIFEFRGFHFMLSIWNRPAPDSYAEPYGPIVGTPSGTMFHPKVFEFRCKNRRSQLVRLKWRR
jgi:hypothetical protein